jgi:NSS family neurotransmitter:Na+ symporter
MPHPAPAWSSRLTFVLAAVGAAVGLGNIWKFPFMAGTNGGGAFVLVYLLCAVVVAIPILMAELVLGRQGAQSPPSTMRNIANSEGRSPRWALLGWMGAIVGFLIVSFYSVIAGWAMAYVVKSANGTFTSFDAAASEQTFHQLLADPLALSLWHGAFMIGNIIVMARGLTRGIEAAVKILMPALFIMLLAMVAYAAYAGAFAEAVNFLFAFEFSKVSGRTVLMAVGQAFFSIGVAMGLMMVYGAYIPRHISITRSALVIALTDTLIAVLAGLAIFPLVFGTGLNPAEGPGLIFITLPIAFGNIPLGNVFGCVFFTLLTFAAFTSSIALLESLVARAAEHPRIGRVTAASVVGFGAWLVGLGTVFSFNLWEKFYPLGALSGFAESTVYDLIDYLTANILMPLGGMLIAVFAGWFVRKKTLLAELNSSHSGLFRIWHWLIRIPVPAAIALIFLANLT